ncbi:MAG: kinase [Alphaproteobacteria bacterium]
MTISDDGSGIETIGSGICQGSFGEILQGVLPGGRKFLVNLRIKDESRVKVSLSSCRYAVEKEAEFARAYAVYPKSHKIVRNILGDLGRHDDYSLDIVRDIPVGKGLSSSTADMVAAVRALAQALSVAFKPDYVSRAITEIEPNDGLHFGGTAAYRHTDGELLFRTDYVPPFRVLGIDFGGIVDTIEFNRRTIVWQESEMAHYERLLADVVAALEAEDAVALARIATESTRLWQKANPKPDLERALGLIRETGALGLANTHSGSFVGLLYEPSRTDFDALAEKVAAAFAPHECRWFETVSCPD